MLTLLLTVALVVFAALAAMVGVAAYRRGQTAALAKTATASAAATSTPVRPSRTPPRIVTNT
ncbi:MAG: hypothetical protein D6784_12335, partial [Chloroflexi bacterium]